MYMESPFSACGNPGTRTSTPIFSFFTNLNHYTTVFAHSILTISSKSNRMPQQLVYLPPAPVPASPYRKRAVKKLNDRMRTIDHRRALKAIMISSLLHQVKKLAPSQFEFTVQPKSNFHSNHHTKRYFKLKAVKIIEKIITRALTWSDLDKVDLAVYQKVAVQVFISKGLAQVVEHLHPKALSPSSITSLVDGLLIELGRGGGDVTANKVQAVVMVCIKDFGHIYRRWQPLSGFEGTAEEAKYLQGIVFNDYFSSSPSTSKVTRSSSTRASKKRGIDDEDVFEERTPVKKAKLDEEFTRDSNLFQRISVWSPIDDEVVDT
ncbi:hypothetical protein FB446DRAFT_817453 [Lentinula raphanica]|nr:hypothetical protein FB446DRAFT_817453 [Lentinula raphanica]